MAWKAIDEYTDKIVKIIEENRSAISSTPYTDETKLIRFALNAEDYQMMYVLLGWYQTLNDIPKFKLQRSRVKELMFKYYPAFSQGYFKS